jgi:hypothetical protein
VVLQKGTGGVGGVGPEESKGLTDEGPTEAAPGNAWVLEQRHQVAEHHRAQDDGYRLTKTASRTAIKPTIVMLSCTAATRGGE